MRFLHVTKTTYLNLTILYNTLICSRRHWKQENKTSSEYMSCWSHPEHFKPYPPRDKPALFDRTHRQERPSHVAAETTLNLQREQDAPRAAQFSSDKTLTTMPSFVTG